MRRLAILIVVGFGLIYAAVGLADPLRYSRSCHSISVGGRTLTIDVVEGHGSCSKAQAIIRKFASSRPPYEKGRKVTVAGETLTCVSWKYVAGGIGWHYVCRSGTFSDVVAGGRYLPARDYKSH